MNNVVCSKGHVYDADKHSSCPYCGVNIGNFEIGGTRTQALGGGMQPHAIPSSPRALEGGNKTQPLQSSGGMMAHQNVGRTCALDGVEEKKKETNKTVAMYSNLEDKERRIDPVVGWLVATSGENKGKDYKILSGGNQIGRSASCDIVLSDETVSREEHASITYDPEGNCFYIVPGAKRGVTYLNGEIVLMPKALHNYDRLRFGKAEVVFIGLCSDMFRW